MKQRKATLVVKALMLTAVVAATTMGFAAPAWAGQNVSARIDFGALQTDVYGAFRHKGDGPAGGLLRQQGRLLYPGARSLLVHRRNEDLLRREAR